MNTQDFVEIPNTTDDFEKNDPDEENPAVNSDTSYEKAPLDAPVIPEKPKSKTAAPVTSVREPIDKEPPVIWPSSHIDPPVVNAGSLAPLLNLEDSEHLRTRWNEIQGMFVDEPRAAVQEADALVSEVLKKILQIFTSEHSSLEGQWNQGIDVSTEDLRKALQHYRSFFNRLVV